MKRTPKQKLRLLYQTVRTIGGEAFCFVKCIFYQKIDKKYIFLQVDPHEEEKFAKRLINIVKTYKGEIALDFVTFVYYS